MKVFLSSTTLDLNAYRQIADDTILRLAQQTVAMERFGPLPGMPVDECERLARESDVMVCIVAHRYGFVPEKGEGSITQREVEAAKNAGKDVLVWIVDDNFPWAEKKEQDLLADPNVINDPARVEEVREGVAGLIEFKAWLRKTFTPETFTTQDDLGRKIAITLGAYSRGHAGTPLSQKRISISRLPTSGAELFGREAELQLLDDAWENPNTNIVSFVAWGGVGKTALVNHWLKKRMVRDNYRGAERVYGWSFFSQGTSERATSADLFIDQALRWFGDKDPTAGSPWDKGERLAGYLRHTRTLLVLDGLEPLQHPPGAQEGRLKDAAMQALLVELAAQQSGLCVISTRERIGDLVDFEESTVIKHDLEYLSPQAGAQILRALKVRGADEELEEASREFGGHAFSLTLLGSYLEEVFQGDIRRRKEIQNLFEDTRYGDKAHAMIAAYERWLGEGMELAILRLLGFFDRPADAATIAALREPPAISGLTESLQHFKAREWNRAVAKLRRIRLLADSSSSEPADLDAHPLLREHFKQQLKRDRLEAWREGNYRLYDHLKGATKEFPDTFEDLSPLYACVTHGCAAGIHQQAFTEVFFRRILRGNAHFSVHELSAYGADLAALSSFFVRTWDKPVEELSSNHKAFLLGAAGHNLRALGRLREAVQPTRASAEADVSKNDWVNATLSTINLSEILLTMGDTAEAIELAKNSTIFADRSADPFQRMVSRAVLANALHQAGNSVRALRVFDEAETIQRESRPETPFLYTTQGFFYCDLLLDQKQAEQVKRRAKKTLEVAKRANWPLFVALDQLSLARAEVLKAQWENNLDRRSVENVFQRAVDDLRLAGHQEFIVRGLLAQAELYRFICEFEMAQDDLAEIWRIASRSGMGLLLADYHLESARLRLAQGDKEKAREHATTANEMIDRMGYHRRDKEVEELEKQLAN